MNDLAKTIFTANLPITFRCFLTCGGKWYCVAPAIGLDGWGATEKEAAEAINTQLQNKNAETYKAHQD